MKKSRLTRSSFIVSVLLPAVAFAGVMQAQRILQDDAGQSAFWIACAAVQFLTAAGYAASSLPKWGGWREADATTRLTLIAGAIGSALAGNLAYYLGFYYFMQAQITCFAGAVGGGFLGEKALAAYFEKFSPFGKVPQTENKG